jgi:hypothetical protein
VSAGAAAVGGVVGAGAGTGAGAAVGAESVGFTVGAGAEGAIVGVTGVGLCAAGWAVCSARLTAGRRSALRAA